MTETYQPKKAVVIESPYAGSAAEVAGNVAYGWSCVVDSLQRGEAPFGGHLFYTQILADSIVGQRRMGINSHKTWVSKADLLAVYTDRGITKGMQEAIDYAENFGIPIERRKLG